MDKTVGKKGERRKKKKNMIVGMPLVTDFQGTPQSSYQFSSTSFLRLSSTLLLTLSNKTSLLLGSDWNFDSMDAQHHSSDRCGSGWGPGGERRRGRPGISIDYAANRGACRVCREEVRWSRPIARTRRDIAFRIMTSYYDFVFCCLFLVCLPCSVLCRWILLSGCPCHLDMYGGCTLCIHMHVLLSLCNND